MTCRGPAAPAPASGLLTRSRLDQPLDGAGGLGEHAIGLLVVTRPHGSGDFRLDQGTGVLPQMWAALPLWRAGGSLDADASAWSEADVWQLGRSLLYAGDDQTDEDVFQAAPASTWTIKVGPGKTHARHSIRDVAEVRALLARLAGVEASAI